VFYLVKPKEKYIVPRLSRAAVGFSFGLYGDNTHPAKNYSTYILAQKKEESIIKVLIKFLI
jgi:hypothetical protein